MSASKIKFDFGALFMNMTLVLHYHMNHEAMCYGLTIVTFIQVQTFQALPWTGV